MKKKEIKKLRLSRETLQTLTSSDAQNVVGGAGASIYSSITAGQSAEANGADCCD